MHWRPPGLSSQPSPPCLRSRFSRENLRVHVRLNSYTRSSSSVSPCWAVQVITTARKVCPRRRAPSSARTLSRCAHCPRRRAPSSTCTRSALVNVHTQSRGVGEGGHAGHQYGAQGPGGVEILRRKVRRHAGPHPPRTSDLPFPPSSPHPKSTP